MNPWVPCQWTKDGKPYMWSKKPEKIVNSIKDLVGPGKTVHFEFYRKGELHYKTSDGFEFVVPSADCGDAEFLKEDKAILFMRYIRKQMEANTAGRQQTETA